MQVSKYFEACSSCPPFRPRNCNSSRLRSTVAKLVITRVKSQWANNRVHEHGHVFEVLREGHGKGGPHMKEGSFFIMCTDDDCDWCGWISPEDADFTITKGD